MDAGIVIVACAARLAIERLRGLQHGASDLGMLFIPNLSWWWSKPRWRGGWNPWVFGGYPADGDPLLGQLHPLGLLYAFAPPFTAAAIEGVVTPAAAGIGMLAYLRTIGCQRWASMAGALSFAMGGFVAANSPHPLHLRTVAVIPWALAAIESLDGATLGAAVGLAVAAMIAGGHPQTVAYSLGIVALYGVVHGKATLPRRAAILATAFVLGLGLTAAVWLPAAQFISYSTHAGASEHPLTASAAIVNDPDRLGSLRLASGLLIPFVTGGAESFPYGPSAWQPPCGVIECTGYPGLLVWMALIAGIPVLIRNRRGRFWLIVALVGVVLSTGLIGEIPPVRGVRAPVRFLLFWSLAVAAASGLALNDVLSASAASRSVNWRLRTWYVAIGLLAVALALAGLSQIAAWRLVAVMGVLLLVSAASVLVSLNRRRPVGWILVVVLAGDLLIFDASLPGGSPVARHRSDLEMMRSITNAVPGSGLDRILVLPWLPAANWASRLHIRLLQGFNAIVLHALADLLGADPNTRWIEIGLISDPTLASSASRVLDLLRCRAIAVPDRATDSLSNELSRIAGTHGGRWNRLGTMETPGFEIYLNQRVRPVAWLVHDIRVLPAAEILRLVRGEIPERAFDPATEALATHAFPDVSSPPAYGPEEEPVEVLSYEDDEFRLAASPAHNALLVTSELAYPGWKATIDGHPTPVDTVNGGLRAIVVPAGHHDIIFAYEPRLSRLGYWTGGVSLIALVGWAVSGIALRRAS